MTVDTLLSRLDGVRRSGGGHVARCPAHEDRTASLSIAEGDAGRVLVHCFAGCATSDVLAAVGMELADLFPEREQDRSPQGRRQFVREQSRDVVLAVVARESAVVAAAAHAIVDGALLDSDDLTRLAIALERIEHCRTELAA